MVTSRQHIYCRGVLFFGDLNQNALRPMGNLNLLSIPMEFSSVEARTTKDGSDHIINSFMTQATITLDIDLNSFSDADLHLLMASFGFNSEKKLIFSGINIANNTAITVHFPKASIVPANQVNLAPNDDQVTSTQFKAYLLSIPPFIIDSEINYICTVTSVIVETPVLFPNDLPTTARVFLGAAPTGWIGLFYAANYQSDPPPIPQLVDFLPPSPWGNTVGFPIAMASATVLDRTNSVVFTLLGGSVTSINLDLDDLFNNLSNYALVGSEVIRFSSLSLVDNLVVLGPPLIRGTRGTELAIANHTSGETVFLLDNALQYNLGLPSHRTLHSAVEINTDLSQSLIIQYQAIGVGYRPYAPAHLKAVQSGQDWILSWIRRSPSFSWDASLESWESEVYSVTIFGGRSIQTTTENFIYSSMEQIEDFGELLSEIHFEVAQVSAFFGVGPASSF